MNETLDQRAQSYAEQRGLRHSGCYKGKLCRRCDFAHNLAEFCRAELEAAAKIADDPMIDPDDAAKAIRERAK